MCTHDWLRNCTTTPTSPQKPHKLYFIPKKPPTLKTGVSSITHVHKYIYATLLIKSHPQHSRIQFYSPFITHFITSHKLVEDKKHKYKQTKSQRESKILHIYILRFFFNTSQSGLSPRQRSPIATAEPPSPQCGLGHPLASLATRPSLPGLQPASPPP